MLFRSNDLREIVGNKDDGVAALSDTLHMFVQFFTPLLGKPYTSVAVKMSTMELSRLAQPGQTFYGLGKMSDNIVIFGGGVPLKVGDSIIGGLGISGGTGEEDNSLAEYGLQVLNEVL